jgi:hypothetical protein
MNVPLANIPRLRRQIRIYKPVIKHTPPESSQYDPMRLHLFVRQHFHAIKAMLLNQQIPQHMNGLADS